MKPMGKTSTLLYIFNNFDKSELIYDVADIDKDLKTFDHVWSFIEKNIKSVPDHVVDNIMNIVQDS